jgi:hypothetical protein
MNLVAIQCECCGVYILCPVKMQESIGYIKPVVQLIMKECPTCYEPFEPIIHTVAFKTQHKMPQGGLIT